VLFQAVIACHHARFRDMRQYAQTAEELGGRTRRYAYFFIEAGRP
jgi:hypothetical protein